MSVDGRNPWDLVKEQLKNKLSAGSFDNWVSPTRFGGIEGKTLYVEVPDETAVSWLRTEYSDEIKQLTRALGLGLDRVELHHRPSRTPGLPGSPMNSPYPSHHGDQNSSDDEFESPVSLNPRFTFESLRGRRLQPIRARRGAVRSNESFPQL